MSEFVGAFTLSRVARRASVRERSVFKYRHNVAILRKTILLGFRIRLVSLSSPKVV